GRSRHPSVPCRRRAGRWACRARSRASRWRRPRPWSRGPRPPRARGDSGATRTTRRTRTGGASPGRRSRGRARARRAGGSRASRQRSPRRSYPRDIALSSPHVRPSDLATCISCGLCLNDCPTYRVLGEEADSPRGRIQLIRDLVTVEGGSVPFGSPGPPSARLVEHLEACLVCRACETACPSGVPFGRIMEGAREVLREREPTGPLTRALRRAGLDTLTRPGRHAGEGERARELARLNIDAFAGSDATIVVNAAGCGAHMKAYGELLADDEAWAERARAAAARVRDLSEVVKPRPLDASRPMRVAY